MIKDIVEQPDEEIHRARYVGRGGEFPCTLGVCHSTWPLYMFTNLKVLQTLYFGDFYGSFITCVSSVINSIPTPFPFPKDGWCGESSKPLIMASSFWWPAAILKQSRSPPKVTSLEQKTLLSPGKSQGIWELSVRNQGQRPNIRTKEAPSAFIT